MINKLHKAYRKIKMQKYLLYMNSLSTINDYLYYIFIALWIILCFLNAIFIIYVFTSKKKLARELFNKKDIKYLFFSSIYKLFKYYFSREKEKNKLNLLKRIIKLDLTFIILIGLSMILIIIFQISLGYFQMNT